MIHPVVQQHGSDHFVHDPRYVDPLPAWLFDPKALARQGLISGTSSGRNDAWFFTLTGQPMVLRHYWRGGIVARFAADVYVWIGRERTRPFREWRLLAHLRDLGLPVSAPVAARARRHGPGYRADLITAAIPGARPLAERLQSGPLPAEAWHRLGAVIAECHAAGACHADLNCRNILLDEQDSPWIIDWDQSHLRAPRSRWRQANLDRLRRSLAKEPLLDARAIAGWEHLLAGYRSA